VDNNILIGLIGLSSSGVVAVTALALNCRGFAAIDSRFASIDNRFASIDNRFASMERRFDMLQNDMKDLNKTMTAIEVDVALVKDKVGL
jgi:septation ring formation regulator EzrA